ncbi:hypothetical protein [Pseudorhodoplanes sp.]|jgi:hypothetical protein|uniref:hypothetical protein n=1 Tax=Pseudorhodoplanes sp. TaxID=1934341 RepID=UPI002B9824BB|nr:hypothetical protein [Pseudorhodoplanes sp.]HWV44268.1 hypothetical protein [Pseudorhodoplanes sp.]
MFFVRLRLPIKSIMGFAAALAVAGCAGSGNTPTTTAPVAAEIPPAIKSQEITGRWGLAAFHNPQDLKRTEAAARNGCRQPYNIGMGPNGGVIMHMPDKAQPEELRLKGGPGNKTYIGPAGEPAGGMQDREITSFDGRTMTVRFLDPEVAGRYGTQVFVRCAPRA